MKKFVAAMMLVGTAFTASACSTSSSTGYVDQAPYADERTVGEEKSRAPSAEKVFVRKQAK